MNATLTISISAPPSNGGAGIQECLPHRRSRRRSRGRGFTLIEVLATLLLLAIALPAIGRGFALSSRAAELARTRTDASGLAESKLNELVATGIWQSGANMTGGFDDHPEFQWSATLAPWGSGQGAQGTNTVQQMDVVVTWNAAGGSESVTVSTLVYQSPNAWRTVLGGPMTPNAPDASRRSRGVRDRIQQSRAAACHARTSSSRLHAPGIDALHDAGGGGIAVIAGRDASTARIQVAQPASRRSKPCERSSW